MSDELDGKDEIIADLVEKVQAAEGARKETLENLNTVVRSHREIAAQLVVAKGRIAQLEGKSRGDGAFKMPDDVYRVPGSSFAPPVYRRRETDHVAEGARALQQPMQKPKNGDTRESYGEKEVFVYGKWYLITDNRSRES